MKNALWDRGSYFKGNPNKIVADPPGIPGIVPTNRTRHPIMGAAKSISNNFNAFTGPVYDVTTGAALTREQLLAFEFFYDGTLTRVPPEICLWMAMKEADISISWSGLSVSQLVNSGYVYERDLEEGRKRTPETTYNQAGIYLPNNAISAPTSQHPYTSVFSRFNVDPTHFNFLNPRRAIHGGVTDIDRQLDGTISLSFTNGGYFILSEEDFSVGSFSATQEIDTGIPIGVEGNTFKLEYAVLTGAYDKSITFSNYYGRPLYLDAYKVWVAPVEGVGGFLDIQKQTIVFTGGAYDVLYPEYGEQLDEIEAGLQADDVIVSTESIPVGQPRISLSPIDENNDNYDRFAGPMTVSAKVTKQMPRFLSGQV
jgi:hypothetical protein